MPGNSPWETLGTRLASLPAVDGRVSWGEAVSLRTTLKIGGPARALVRCSRPAGVAAVLQAVTECGLPWFVLGWGGNVLLPDEGLEAVVVQLDGELGAIGRDGARLRAGGGASLARLVRVSIEAGLAGIECLGGIPSTLGGALAMNAGAYGQELLDVLAWAEVVESNGAMRRLERREVEGGYRWSVLGKGRIVTRAELALREDDPAALRERAAGVRARRLRALPSEASAGSVFRNPPGDYAGRLLEQAGCKGLQHGGARVSERHANVIVNSGGAHACDVRALIREMAQRVRAKFALALELELKILRTDGSLVADPEAPD